jgi:TrmH family RNA methyltransferase
MLTERRRKEIASLAQRKYRVRLGQTIVEGLRAVAGAVDAGAPLVEVVVTHEAAADAETATILRRAPVPVHQVDARSFGRLSEVESPQGILAVVETRQQSPSSFHSRRSVLALDGVQDPGNVGALIRAGSWFGVDGILVGAGSADPFSPKVVRASMSALWAVDLAETDDLAAELRALSADGFRIYGADLEGMSAHDWRPAMPSVLVLGSEAHGIRPEVRACVDERVTIPGGIRGGASDSLNVATAGAVLLYQWTR